MKLFITTSIIAYVIVSASNILDYNNSGNQMQNSSYNGNVENTPFTYTTHMDGYMGNIEYHNQNNINSSNQMQNNTYSGSSQMQNNPYNGNVKNNPSTYASHIWLRRKYRIL